MAEDEKSGDDSKKKYPFVVKLDKDDRERLEYVADMTHLTKTNVVRSLIREASEGHVPGKRMSFTFPPFSRRDAVDEYEPGDTPPAEAKPAADE